MYLPSVNSKGLCLARHWISPFFFYLLSFPQGDFTVWVWFYIKYVSLICTIRKTSSLVSILALLTNERHLGSSVYTIWMTLKRIWVECSYLLFKQISFYLIVWKNKLPLYKFLKKDRMSFTNSKTLKFKPNAVNSMVLVIGPSGTEKN